MQSISVDSQGRQLVQSSSRGKASKQIGGGAGNKKKEEPVQHREEWEEDLTSTQNLGLSGSHGKSNK